METKVAYCVHGGLLPAIGFVDWIVLDIETVGGDLSDAEWWMRQAWKPASNWKPETIGQRWLDALEVKKERLALIDGSPIISVSLATMRNGVVQLGCWHWLDCDEAALCGASLVRVADEREMLQQLRAFMLCAGGETVLAGHNIRGFDLPRLRRAYLKHNLQLPACLAWRDQPQYDTMREWSRYSMDDRQFVSLGECLVAAGIPNHKTDVSGADVGRLFDERQYKRLLEYAVTDVATETELFLRMTGQKVDG